MYPFTGRPQSPASAAVGHRYARGADPKIVPRLCAHTSIAGLLSNAIMC